MVSSPWLFIVQIYQFQGLRNQFLQKKVRQDPQKRVIPERRTYKLLVVSNKKEVGMRKELIIFLLNVVFELLKFILG